MVKKVFSFIVVFLVLIGFGFASWHSASSVVSGLFNGDYVYNGSVDFTNATVTGLSGVEASGVPIGTILAFPYESCPSGWLVADGANVSRSIYANLYNKIGVTYGSGDGSTTFGLPDYRGYFLRGLDNGAGNDPDAASRTDRGDGTTGDVVGSVQTDDFMSHTHGISAAAGGVSGAYGYYAASSDIFQSKPKGGSETRPKNVNVLYCINYDSDGNWESGGTFSSFSVHRNGVDQSISTSTWTDVDWTSEDFDNLEEFNLTNDRFKPKVAGKYLFIGKVGFASLNDGDIGDVAIYKNGLLIAYGNRIRTGSGVDFINTISLIVDVNVGDYFELKAYHTKGVSTNIYGTTSYTYFSGTRLDSDSYWSYDGGDISYTGGNVGIGTSSPNASLHVVGSTIIEQEAWQNATLANGWVNYGGGYNDASYFKDSQGIVHLRGLVKSGSAVVCMFTLPVGYRPENRELHSILSNAVVGRIDIDNVGCVSGASPISSVWASLDGITFRAYN